MQPVPGAQTAPVPTGPAVSALSPDDTAATAHLHASQLGHGFFGCLGERFLAAYHATFLASPHAVAFVAASGDRTVGFLVGTLAPQGHTRWVLRERGRRLAVLGALALAARPALAARFVRTRSGPYARRLLTGRRDRTPVPAADLRLRVAVLTHVAVDPSVRGSGVGSALVDAFVDSARCAGAERALLVTLEGERGAGPFYERLGWARTDSRTDRDGHPIAEFGLALR